ncbi:hypothetical protein HDU96_010211 [Phlyctochytrium bullatum]|nr:hypothetical protein HDU96_010211 [Phlyctochytrium bullatum]
MVSKLSQPAPLSTSQLLFLDSITLFPMATDPPSPPSPPYSTLRLPAGRHTWPFSFRVPPVPSLPPTYRGKVGQVRYEAIGTLERPGLHLTASAAAKSATGAEQQGLTPLIGPFALAPSENSGVRKRKARRELAVRSIEGREATTAFESPARVTVEAGVGSLWWKCGKVEVSASLPRSAFAFDERIPITFSITNHSTDGVLISDVAIEERCLCTYSDGSFWGPTTTQRIPFFFSETFGPSQRSVNRSLRISLPVLEPTTAQPPETGSLALSVASSVASSLFFRGGPGGTGPFGSGMIGLNASFSSNLLTVSHYLVVSVRSTRSGSPQKTIEIPIVLVAIPKTRALLHQAAHLMAIVDEADREAARRGASIDTLPLYTPRLSIDGPSHWVSPTGVVRTGHVEVVMEEDEEVDDDEFEDASDDEESDGDEGLRFDEDEETADPLAHVSGEELSRLMGGSLGRQSQGQGADADDDDDDGYRNGASIAVPITEYDDEDGSDESTETPCTPCTPSEEGPPVEVEQLGAGVEAAKEQSENLVKTSRTTFSLSSPISSSYTDRSSTAVAAASFGEKRCFSSSPSSAASASTPAPASSVASSRALSPQRPPFELTSSSSSSMPTIAPAQAASSASVGVASCSHLADVSVPAGSVLPPRNGADSSDSEDDDGDVVVVDALTSFSTNTSPSERHPVLEVIGGGTNTNTVSASSSYYDGSASAAPSTHEGESDDYTIRRALGASNLAASQPANEGAEASTSSPSAEERAASGSPGSESDGPPPPPPLPSEPAPGYDQAVGERPPSRRRRRRVRAAGTRSLPALRDAVRDLPEAERTALEVAAAAAAIRITEDYSWMSNPPPEYTSLEEGAAAGNNAASAAAGPSGTTNAGAEAPAEGAANTAATGPSRSESAAPAPGDDSDDSAVVIQPMYGASTPGNHASAAPRSGNAQRNSTASSSNATSRSSHQGLRRHRSSSAAGVRPSMSLSLSNRRTGRRRESIGPNAGDAAGEPEPPMPENRQRSASRGASDARSTLSAAGSSFGGSSRDFFNPVRQIVRRWSSSNLSRNQGSREWESASSVNAESSSRRGEDGAGRGSRTSSLDVLPPVPPVPPIAAVTSSFTASSSSTAASVSAESTPSSSSTAGPRSSNPFRRSMNSALGDTSRQPSRLQRSMSQVFGFGREEAPISAEAVGQETVAARGRWGRRGTIANVLAGGEVTASSLPVASPPPPPILSGPLDPPSADSVTNRPLPLLPGENAEERVGGLRQVASMADIGSDRTMQDRIEAPLPPIPGPRSQTEVDTPRRAFLPSALGRLLNGGSQVLNTTAPSVAGTTGVGMMSRIRSWRSAEALSRLTLGTRTAVRDAASPEVQQAESATAASSGPRPYRPGLMPQRRVTTNNATGGGGIGWLGGVLPMRPNRRFDQPHAVGGEAAAGGAPPTAVSLAVPSGAVAGNAVGGGVSPSSNVDELVPLHMDPLLANVAAGVAEECPDSPRVVSALAQHRPVVIV